MIYQAFFDGSCGPSQRGSAAYGFIVKNDNGDTVYSGHGRVGRGVSMSSNVAEFEGLYQAMLYMASHYPNDEVQFHGDSTLVITLMRGESQAKKGRYLPYYRKSIQFAEPYIQKNQWTFHWIQRGFNSEADNLAQYHRY